jgi:hypothetical protein
MGSPLNQGCYNKGSEVVSQPAGVVFGKQDVGNPDVFHPRTKTRQAQTFLKSLATKISTRSVEVWCLDRSAKAGSRDGRRGRCPELPRHADWRKTWKRLHFCECKRACSLMRSSKMVSLERLTSDQTRHGTQFVSASHLALAGGAACKPLPIGRHRKLPRSRVAIAGIVAPVASWKHPVSLLKHRRKRRFTCYL